MTLSLDRRSLPVFLSTVYSSYSIMSSRCSSLQLKWITTHETYEAIVAGATVKSFLGRSRRRAGKQSVLLPEEDPSIFMKEFLS